MAMVDTTRSLLMMALQDLCDGERQMAERLPEVRGWLASEIMQSIVEEDARRSAEQRDAFAHFIEQVDASRGEANNIWVNAILEDARNDAETIVRGPLRDVALAGALRKAKQSQRVSYQTAIALARNLEKMAMAERMVQMAQDAEETDEKLARAMERMAKRAMENCP
ncbi:DUF892 family protein [Sphingomicrobium lutaoense]|uniref:Ferritin-like metal-binding protein YciE n=1 Tax=Sphingomicrobium lutaoense TaxID=515949 RepID=A0A839Z7B8_9SPHN|nr:DUF892 family protein [Sphingomicrobium lutaoense]MBB3764714.1 ferritin-like metal-binding protein YciE [Sphingomicrobium lutaoense]